MAEDHSQANENYSDALKYAFGHKGDFSDELERLRREQLAAMQIIRGSFPSLYANVPGLIQKSKLVEGYVYLYPFLHIGMNALRIDSMIVHSQDIVCALYESAPVGHQAPTERVAVYDGRNFILDRDGYPYRHITLMPGLYWLAGHDIIKEPLPGPAATMKHETIARYRFQDPYGTLKPESFYPRKLTIPIEFVRTPFGQVRLRFDSIGGNGPSGVHTLGVYKRSDKTQAPQIEDDDFNEEEDTRTEDE